MVVFLTLDNLDPEHQITILQRPSDVPHRLDHLQVSKFSSRELFRLNVCVVVSGGTINQVFL